MFYAAFYPRRLRGKHKRNVLNQTFGACPPLHLGRAFMKSYVDLPPFRSDYQLCLYCVTMTTSKRVYVHAAENAGIYRHLKSVCIDCHRNVVGV